ncbi:Hypothetical predicted protein [Mytilus galloprovincialis]|uniref:LRAT domain-containing protein n=1 Tax=Mytilus galloprovincialis TaxID=29158 RepID=A0A8B6EW62_MYTGA|nr:Hypothetical predicted protein [Mytilus galloprovincialis]
MADSSNTTTFSNKGYSSAEDDTSGIELKEKNSDILENYDDFRCKCKLLSHIKVRRKSDDFHHFVVFAIAEVSNGIDAVTIGHYTHPAEIGMESWENIGKFVQHTFLMKENDKHTRTHDILDFERGVYLVKHENYPSTTKAIEEAFNCLSERIGQYDILTDNCEHAISCMLTRDKIRTQKENTKISSPEDQNKLKNYDDFRLKCKPLSHIKVKRERDCLLDKFDYFHHFVVLSISEVDNDTDAVTIGQYTSSGEIGMESFEGIGKFIQETVFSGEKDTPDIFDFKQGMYLVEKENYPSTKIEFEEAFNRLNSRIGERKYELLSNNCEHAINYIFTGESVSDQTDADSITFSRKCFNDMFNILIIDCKEVGLKTALLVAALGAVAGSLVRRAYVRVIIAAIVSLTVESSIIKCGDKRGSNLRKEADIRIDLASYLPDINDALKNTSIAILEDVKNHTDTNFVCNIAEKLIYEAAMTTCLATVAFATGIETILFLSFVFNNLIARRRKKTLEAKDLCRMLFLQLFAGYGSIGIAVVCGYFAFLDFNRPALSFFGIVFGCCIVFRYILTCTAGMIFSVCFYECCWDCFDESSCCKCDEDSSCHFRCYKCHFSTFCFIFLSSVIFLVGACLVVIVFWND